MYWREGSPLIAAFGFIPVILKVIPKTWTHLMALAMYCFVPRQKWLVRILIGVASVFPPTLPDLHFPLAHWQWELTMWISIFVPFFGPWVFELCNETFGMPATNGRRTSFAAPGTWIRARPFSYLVNGAFVALAGLIAGALGAYLSQKECDAACEALALAEMRQLTIAVIAGVVPYWRQHFSPWHIAIIIGIIGFLMSPEPKIYSEGTRMVE
jgi:hypothetical protein